MASSYKCPACGSRDNVRIVYGMPSPEMFEAAEAGSVAIGGCLVGDQDPTRACRACGAHFWPDGRYLDPAPGDDSLFDVPPVTAGSPPPPPIAHATQEENNHDT